MAAETTGERLRVARRKARLSAQELGRKAALELGRDRPISASAVRNQENGTNGIPLDTLYAYAAVLKMPAQWFLWGDDPFDFNTAHTQAEAEAAAQADADSDAPSFEEIFDEIAVQKLGFISAQWAPLMIDPKRRGTEDLFIHVRVPGWHAEKDKLRAYEVLDHSLEPFVRRGAYIIAADALRAWADEGAWVIAGTWRGGDNVYALRKLRFLPGDTGQNVDIVSFDGDPNETRQIIRDGVPLDEVFVDWIVIATLDLHAPKSRAIVLPSTLTLADAPDPADTAEVSMVTRRLRRQSLKDHFKTLRETDADAEGLPIERPDEEN